MDIRSRTAAAGVEEAPGLLETLGLRPTRNRFAIEAHMAAVRRTSATWMGAVCAQLVAVAVILAGTWFGRHLDALLYLAATSGVIVLTSICGALAMKTRAFRRAPPPRQIAALLPLAVVSGASLAVLGWQIGLLPNSPIRTIGLSAAIAAAVAVTIALMPVRAAVLAAVGSLTLVGATLVASPVMAIIGIGFLACLWAMVISQARFDAYLNRRSKQEIENSRRANRLISHFETHGEGWFWETDRAGDLTYLSAKLAKILGRDASSVLGQAFTDIIRSDEGDGGERTVGFHLSTRSAFSDIPVRANVDGEDEDDRWWSVSGHPIVDNVGQFRGFVGNGTDLTEKRRSENEANRLARFDELTGLANRQQMRLAIERALPTEFGSRDPFALFLLDLDRFKSVNDTMGHLVGDALLKQVAQRLFRAVGDMGMVGRLGGDEFQILLPREDRQKKLAEFARTVIATVSEPYMIDGVTLTIGCSIGIAVAPDHGGSSEELVRNADLALYAAKDDGRGVHRFYEKEMHAGATKRKRLEDDLRKALENGELHLTYQPVVSTKDETVIGYEALIRWHHPSHGAISPEDFIPVAEDIRLIEQIGEWVLRTACKDAVTWPGNVRVAVNVSPIQFANPALPAVVTSALAEAGLPPERLELEITESVFLDEDANTDKMFKSLKAIGVRLALDDFGTGYSSLGYLKSAPFDKIKIDQSFIRGAAVPGNRNAAIIKSIVSLAETLYMETTAEGVEVQDEIALIRELGCSHIQGYIYGKPMRTDEAKRMLESANGKAVASGYQASRSPRAAMLRSSQVELDGKTKRVRIRNLSATGALLEGLEGVAADTDVLIEVLEDQMFPARVKWAKGDRVGIEFARSFDLERLNPGGPAKPESAEPPKRAANG